jgi:hypothetical protein
MYSELTLHTFRSTQTRFEVPVGSAAWYWEDVHLLKVSQFLFELDVGAEDSNCVNESQIVKSAHTRLDVSVGSAVWYCHKELQLVTCLHTGASLSLKAEPDAVYCVPATQVYQY